MYDAPAGWHWGSKAEVAAIMGGGQEERQPKKLCYYNQGWWDGFAAFAWGRVERHAFVFSDSLEVGGFLGSDHGEGEIAELAAAALAEELLTMYFAGIVYVAD